MTHRGVPRAIATLILASAAWGFPVHSSAAEPGGTGKVQGTVSGSALDLLAERKRDAVASTRQGTNVRNAVPQYSYAKIPACAGNDINTGVDVPCVEATTACGQPGVYQWWLYRAPYRAGAPLTIGQPGWERTGTLCASTAAAGTDPLVPAYSLADFRRLPLPAGTSRVEPPGGYVLVTMPTNVFTTATDPLVLDTVLAGIPIQVRATPARWSWDFGDGKGRVGPTDQPGAAYPSLTHTHAYAERGSYDITMTTYYTGEYTLDGATWLPIVGEAEVTGPPTTVQALAGRNVLVAEP